MLKKNNFRQTKNLTSTVLAMPTTEICLTMHEQNGHIKPHIFLDNIIHCYLNIGCIVYI